VIRKNIANVITITRILISLGLILLEVKSIAFMVLYLIASLSDVLDGFVARKMNIQSKLGSKLDTISDVVFFFALIYKFWNLLCMHTWQIVGFIAIVLVKIVSIIIIYSITHSIIVDVHSLINKFTGVLLFFLPITINLFVDKYYIYLLIIFAFVASIDEMIRVISESKAVRINSVK